MRDIKIKETENFYNAIVDKLLFMHFTQNHFKSLKIHCFIPIKYLN